MAAAREGVADVYERIPSPNADLRGVRGDYGEAGAIDRYGPAFDSSVFGARRLRPFWIPPETTVPSSCSDTRTLPRTSAVPHRGDDRQLWGRRRRGAGVVFVCTKPRVRWAVLWNRSTISMLDGGGEILDGSISAATGVV